MFAFTNSSAKTSPTIVGAGCVVNGDIKTEHTVQIHGTVLGNIRANVVVIGRGGRVVGRVLTDDFFLHGTMDGPAVVSTAHVFSNATMTGTLSYHTLNITGNNALECKLSKRK